MQSNDRISAPKVWIFGALAVFLLSALPVVAQSVTELLEKGIYLEETAGQVEEAIEIYHRIVTDATADRVTVAEALLRLGLCHLEQGDDGAATEAFRRLLSDYPEQEPFAARAREHMPGRTESLELLPAPWDDGEVTRLSLKLASGTPIGAMLFSAGAAELEGEELWRLRVRTKIFSDADNQGISQVLARRDTMTPVRSVYKRVGVGHFEARYGDGSVTIGTLGTEHRRVQKADGLVFDNEQGYHLFRRLPLEEGARWTIKFLSAVAGGANPIDVEVTGRERIEVPAGELECYRLELSNQQLFWISTDPSRQLVKFEAAGIAGELEEVYVQQPGRENPYSYRLPGSKGTGEQPGFSVTLPPDWLFHRFESHGIEVLFLLDPKAEAQTRMEIRRARIVVGDCSFQAAAHHKLGQAKTALRDYLLRDGTWSEREHAGWPLVSFVGDYRERGTDRVHYWTFIDHGRFCVDFTLKVAADRFDDLRAVFDRIIESYQGPAFQAAVVSESEAEAAAGSVLADFHLAVWNADLEGAFEHLAPDAVFFGPDAADRFDMDELRDRFTDVAEWLVEAFDRHVIVSADETLAWFDQRLWSPGLGELRGTGVLRREPAGRWRIVQVHVGMPVPNELVAELVERLRAHDEATGRQPVEVAPPLEASADDPASSALRFLRDVHVAKGEGDGSRYYRMFAPEAVALGTARSERFSLAGLQAILAPYYAQGRRPISIPIEQRVYLSPDQNLAWFEELIERQQLGLMRGTGVMRRAGDTWKLVHYNLMFVVPRELAGDLARRIEAFYAPRAPRNSSLQLDFLGPAPPRQGRARCAHPTLRPSFRSPLADLCAKDS